MRGPPGLNTLHVVGAAEVILIAGLSEPAALTGLFAGASARGIVAVFLASAIAGIGDEKSFAMETLAAGVRRLHRAEACRVARQWQPPQVGTKSKAGKKTEKEENKRFWAKDRKKTKPGRRYIFKPADLPRFQPAADRAD